MNERALATKLAKLDEKLKKVKAKNVASNCKLRLERSRRKEVTSSRDHWRSRFKILEGCVKEDGLKRKNQEVEKENIVGHQYSSLVVSLCVSIYMLGNCGYRSTIKVLSGVCVITGLELGKLPSKSSLENWIKKIGYSIYATVSPKYCDCSYGVIVDESMVIGQERLLVILGTRAIKTSITALQMYEVKILYMGVQPSWTGAQVSEQLKKVMEKEGKKACYAISDKGSTMCKGIFEAGLVRVADIGHEIARLTEKCYGTGLLESFLAEAKQSKAKLIMTPMSYLLCPKQRKTARFMNLSTVIEWGRSTLYNFDKLSPKEQSHFEWIKKHQNILTDLSEVFETTEKILKMIKNEGLSYATISSCLAICQQRRQGASLVFTKLLESIELHLNGEKQKLPDANTTWHASSDIIESLFGTYKARKATNPQHGVTPFILFLPIMTKMLPAQEQLDVNCKEALELVLMSDLKTWNQKHLIENQVFKRKYMFKK